MSAKDFIMQLTNAGVLMDMGGRRILIDPFSVAYKGPLKQVYVPFAKTTAYQAWQLIYGEDVFHHVDLMLISHDHIDHYSLPLTVKFLEHHPETTLVAKEYLTEAIRAASGGKLANACLTLGEESGAEQEFRTDGVEIRAWPTQHAGSEEYYRTAKHTTFRLDGPWSCVFLGDMEPSEENFKRIQSAEQPDVAIVPYLYAILRKGEKLLDSCLKPDMVCYNHIPVPDGEAKAWRKAVYARVSTLREKGRNRMILDQFGMMITIRKRHQEGGIKIGRKTEHGYPQNL